MGPYQRTPKQVASAIRYSGLGVRSVGPVGDFLEVTFGKLKTTNLTNLHRGPMIFGWSKNI